VEEQVRSIYHLYLRSLRSIKRLQEATPDGEVAPLGKFLKFLWFNGCVIPSTTWNICLFMITISLMESSIVVNEEEIEY
jgi:hypothetical protein